MRFCSLLFVSSSCLFGAANAFITSTTKRFTTSSFTILKSSTACTTTELTTLETEALSKFFTQEQIEGITAEPATGGVSNRMAFIDVPTTDQETKRRRYLLRIYNNGGNAKVVKFEHDIMKALNDVKLSFATPKALPTLDDPNATHMTLSSGDDACIFEIIPGTLPKLQAVTEIGTACGELHTAMGTLDIDRGLCEQPPYFKLFEVHHAITRDLFYETIASSEFDGKERKAIDELVDHVTNLEQRLDIFHSKNLPEQLIHGDLHYDNVLIEDGKVTGLLDFEYCGFDWRAMELAVCLSKYAGEDDALRYMEDFIIGFARTADLTADEIESVADLMVLRIVSNVVFFVGRVISGEDEADQLKSRAAMYNTRIEWLLDNKQTLGDIITREMNKKVAAA